MRRVTHSLISVFMAGTALSALALPASGQSVEEPVQGEASVEDAVSATVVVIGRRANLMRIPGSGATIEGADLDRAHPLSVSEALRRVAGVYPRDEEGMGMRPNIGVRGLSPVRSTKVLLLEDGIPLSFAPYGDNATYYHPPLDRFRRIEVLKGASQVRFGPQTIGGVVNYITPSAPDEFEARLKLAELPRNSSATRIRNRCEVTGRPRAFYRKLKVSRIALRELGNKGLIPGLVKSSW